MLLPLVLQLILSMLHSFPMYIIPDTDIDDAWYIILTQCHNNYNVLAKVLIYTKITIKQLCRCTDVHVCSRAGQLYYTCSFKLASVTILYYDLNKWYVMST